MLTLRPRSKKPHASHKSADPPQFPVRPCRSPFPISLQETKIPIYRQDGNQFQRTQGLALVIPRGGGLPGPPSPSGLNISSAALPWNQGPRSHPGYLAVGLAADNFDRVPAFLLLPGPACQAQRYERGWSLSHCDSAGDMKDAGDQKDLGKGRVAKVQAWLVAMTPPRDWKSAGA